MTRLGPLGERVRVQEEPGGDVPPLVIHNDRARDGARMAARAPAETTIVETAESLRDLGLLAVAG